jgi:hypothetical protein
MAISCVFGAKPRNVMRTVYAPGRSPWARNAPLAPAIAPVTIADVALFRIVTDARATGALLFWSTIVPFTSPGPAGGGPPGPPGPPGPGP